LFRPYVANGHLPTDSKIDYRYIYETSLSLFSGRQADFMCTREHKVITP
jgi:hypothetical protein